MSNNKDSRNLIQKYIKICLVVITYWIVSISVVFINKTLFSSHLIDINAPLFVTWTQCVTSFCICLCWKKCSTLYPKKIKFPKTNAFSKKTIKCILPFSFLFVLTISFGNISLSFVNVSFYFISRSLTTVFNIIFSYLILNQVTSQKALLCCTIIVFGFFMGVDQEKIVGSFSLTGTLFGVLSSLTLSLYSIYTKKILQKLDNEVILLSYYNNLYSSFLFIPLIFLNGEYGNLVVFHFRDSGFWILTIIGGTFGFLIGFITALQIKTTSPLTHNISGTAKACIQTILATSWYKETKPLLWWFSNFIVLFGSATYTRVRQLEMAQNN